MGPAKWTYFYLYVILDIFSRRVVGRCVADAESATLFKALFDDTLAKHTVPPGQLTLPVDRGGPTEAKATALMLADLGVTKSHSWPHTSNDNPFRGPLQDVEVPAGISQPLRLRRGRQAFGTLRPNVCRRFFAWYNQDHHHAGFGLMTPDQVHYGQAEAVHAARQNTLDRAFPSNPERFVKKLPEPPAEPAAVWINPPQTIPEPPSLN